MKGTTLLACPGKYMPREDRKVRSMRVQEIDDRTTGSTGSQGQSRGKYAGDISV